MMREASKLSGKEVWLKIECWDRKSQRLEPAGTIRLLHKLRTVRPYLRLRVKAGAYNVSERMKRNYFGHEKKKMYLESAGTAIR